jgi:hypothetical protein
VQKRSTLRQRWRYSCVNSEVEGLGPGVCAMGLDWANFRLGIGRLLTLNSVLKNTEVAQS